MQKKKIIIWSIVAILFIPFFSFSVGSDDPPVVPEPYIYWSAPPNSFGISSTKTINYSFLKDLIKDHISYELQYNTGNGWIQANQYLDIGMDWNETGFYKITLTFNKPPTPEIDVRFYIRTSLSVLEYTEVSNQQADIKYQIPDTDEWYNLSFNWSDLMDIPNVEFLKGVSNNEFYFMFQKNDVPANSVWKSYEFDPIFGEQDTGANTMGIENALASGLYTMGSVSGIGNNISAYIKTTGNAKIKCCLYLQSDQSFVTDSETEELVFNTGGANQWHTWNFTGSPVVSADTQYYITIWAQSVAGDHYVMMHATSPDTAYWDSAETYNGFKNPATFSAYPGTSHTCIYVSYTEGGGEPANWWDNTTVFSNPQIANNSWDNSLSLDWNITMYDQNTTFDWNISCSNGQSNGSDNDSNGSKFVNLTGLVNDTQYTIWANATANTSANTTKEIFYFNTQNTTSQYSDWWNNDTILSNPNIANNSWNNPNSLDWNITFYNLNDTFDWRIECNNTQFNYTNNSGNGSYYVNLTGLTNNTDYKIFVNVTANHSANTTKEWFVFNIQNTTSAYSDWWNNDTILSNENPLNNSFENDLAFVFNITMFNLNTTFNWTITCNTSDTSSGNNAGNGSKTLSLAGLSFYENYTIWVNSTSTSGNTTNETFFFTTKNESGGNWSLYVLRSEIMDITISIESSLLGLLITLSLFAFFMYIGYKSDKKSGGFFLLFAGFVLIWGGSLLEPHISAMIYVYIAPIALFIVFMGIAKLFYKPKPKPE